MKPAGSPGALQEEARKLLRDAPVGIINKYSKALLLCADVVSDENESEERRKMAREAINQFRGVSQ